MDEDLGNITARFALSRKELLIACEYRSIQLVMRVPREADGGVDTKSTRLLVSNLFDVIQEGLTEVYVESQKQGLQDELTALLDKEIDDGDTDTTA